MTMTEEEIYEETTPTPENTGKGDEGESVEKPKLIPQIIALLKKIFKGIINGICKAPSMLISGICGIPRFIKKKFHQFHDWFWGTEEHPTHPFCKRGKFRRWFLIHFRHHRILIRTKYIKEEDGVIVDEYLCTYELVHKSEIPRDAVHVTGMKNTWHIDMNLIKRGFSSVSDNGFTAVDSYAYLKCNKIDEAMAIKLDKINSMDTNKILLVGALLFGGVLAVWYLFLQ